MNLAASLKEELAQAEGFLGSERFESLSNPGKLLSKSRWKDEASVERWRNAASHRLFQKHGRTNDFIDYQITVVTPLRSYTMANRQQAPADSNRYLEV